MASDSVWANGWMIAIGSGAILGVGGFFVRRLVRREGKVGQGGSSITQTAKGPALANTGTIGAVHIGDVIARGADPAGSRVETSQQLAARQVVARIELAVGQLEALQHRLGGDGRMMEVESVLGDLEALASNSSQTELQGMESPELAKAVIGYYRDVRETSAEARTCAVRVAEVVGLADAKKLTNLAKVRAQSGCSHGIRDGTHLEAEIAKAFGVGQPVRDWSQGAGGVPDPRDRVKYGVKRFLDRVATVSLSAGAGGPGTPIDPVQLNEVDAALTEFAVITADLHLLKTEGYRDRVSEFVTRVRGDAVRVRRLEEEGEAYWARAHAEHEPGGRYSPETWLSERSAIHEGQASRIRYAALELIRGWRAAAADLLEGLKEQ